MSELEKLCLQLPEADSALLELILEDAQEAVRQMSGRSDVSLYGAAVRAVAVIMWSKIGREGQGSYSAGGVSVSYGELPTEVRHLLPSPLVRVGGKRYENVESKPRT